MSFVPRSYQVESINAGVDFFHDERKSNGVVILPTGCHAAGTGILMFDGTVMNVEDVRVGDRLMGPDSKPRKVIALCRGNEMMYRITPHRACAPFIVNAGHVLHLVSTSEGKKAVSPSHQKGGEITHISVADYCKKSKSWKHLRKLCRAPEVSFNRFAPGPIEPYFLGLMLGDGSTMNGVLSVTTADKIIEEYVSAYASSLGLAVRVDHKKNNAAKSLMIVKSEDRHNRMVENKLMGFLRFLKLDGKDSADKFIPEEYKIGAIPVRSEVLAGLLDADGHHDVKGGYDFISKSLSLANDVAFVARSLGLAASFAPCNKFCQTGNGGVYYRVHISGDTKKIPCRLERKQAPVRLQKKNIRLTGFEIESIGQGDFYGFTLSDDHLYLTEDFIIHHNSGKSVVIANIAKNLTGKTVVFQPSKEILEQNYQKFLSYGYRAGIYSASAGQKHVDHITFATIGSVAKKHFLFKDVKNILVDECHLVSPDGGMYHDFIKATHGAKVLGLTATPYRLEADFEGAQLKWLTQTSPRIFSRVLHYVQNDVLFNAGHLAKLEYFAFNVINRDQLEMNASGTDFTDASLRAFYRQVDMPKVTAKYANYILSNRRNCLVFCALVSEANRVAAMVPGSVVLTGETETIERTRILKLFTAGKIRCVINVGVLTTGFDYPELEAVLIARSTMSLALYYQIVGRVMRPHPSKQSGWVVDLGGNVKFFGKIETMKIQVSERGNYAVYNNGRRLTDTPFSKN